MLNIIFGSIILVCLAIIIVIVVRKLPQLANLRLDTLPEEKQFIKKKEMIAKRIDEHSKLVKARWAKIFSPIRRLLGIVQLNFRIYVGKVDRLWKFEQSTKKTVSVQNAPPKEETIVKVGSLLIEAEQNLVINNLNRAEELYIMAIKYDQKSVVAYRGLAEVYFKKGSLEEARQTYQFVLQLEPDDDSVMVKLAEIAESQGDIEEAIENYQKAILVNDSLSPRFFHLAEMLIKVGQPMVALDAVSQAVELEPKNPKYLDLFLENAIICGNKAVARDVWNQLRLVNPENQKLEIFRDRIDRM
ncbi:MAG: Tetratricopeptide repeat protein [Candidatus Amesbacteria bacterium GW2011_GWA2_42_12]|uniref:Uncharacterized protein n=2 Tax=Patescibacteria group TaxID=1783273 RepID=A0A1F6NJC1_9BACT|nr:MAG: Tetratricopeptide repeat protein [Candidatus Amesbacteria bacterium GW2011_GWA2_42_12]OGH83972.1 MAG: hypothetical protein A2261_03510 [Candidatus Magasanikbacteria bacterium RIFOXYA2_FULL_44_8]